MSADSSQQRLDQAIRLSQLGEKEQSRKILLQLIQENAKNEYAWLWLVDVCDSEKERKAILSRGLKLNPESKLLKTAMKRFVDTGDLRSITDSLDELKAEVETIVQKEVRDVPSASANPFISSADLDWIELDQEKSENEQIETISDDEFSRLSNEFFGSEENKESIDFSNHRKPAAGSNGHSDELSADLFSFDQVDGDEPEFTVRRDTKETINAKELMQNEKKHQAIEDELKGAMAEVKAQKMPKKRFRWPYWRRLSQRVLIILVSTFWLVVFVLAGLFFVQYFDLAPRATNGEAVIATDLPEAGIDIGTPDTTDTPEPEQTEETTPMVFATAVIVEPEPVYAPVFAENFDQLSLIDSLDHTTLAFFNHELDKVALIQPRRIQLLASLGEVLWESDIPQGSSTYLGGVFNPDGEQVAFFTDAMQVEIWSVNRGTRQSTFQLSEEQQAVFTDIPYLPANTRIQLAYSADGTWLAAGFWGGISVWDVNSGDVIHWYALPENILLSSFNANLDVNFVAAFPASSNRLVYGGRENIFLVDLIDERVIQNWKTQYVGRLAFLDENTVVEAGYSLSNSPTYLAVWDADEISPVARRSSLSSQRGFRLPNYSHFVDRNLLVYEIEGATGGSMALEVYSLDERQVLNSFELNTLQPVFAMDTFKENIACIWLNQPQESFGARDTMQLWDVQQGILVGQCDQCSYPAGVFSDTYQLYAREGNDFIVMQARGVGIQWLGQISSPTE
jgi:hypothetical protein